MSPQGGHPSRSGFVGVMDALDRGENVPYRTESR